MQLARYNTIQSGNISGLRCRGVRAWIIRAPQTKILLKLLRIHLVRCLSIDSFRKDELMLVNLFALIARLAALLWPTRAFGVRLYHKIYFLAFI